MSMYLTKKDYHILTAFSPIFTDPPQSAAVQFGSVSTLTCSAMAQPPPTYMWFRLEPSGKNKVEGETGEFLQFNSLLADDRGVYSCSAANELGSIDSEDAILSIEGNVI